MSGAHRMMNTQFAADAVGQHRQMRKVDVSADDALAVTIALRKRQIALYTEKKEVS